MTTPSPERDESEDRSLIEAMVDKFTAVWRDSDGQLGSGSSSVEGQEALIEIAMRAAALVMLGKIRTLTHEQAGAIYDALYSRVEDPPPFETWADLDYDSVEIIWGAAMDAFARAEGLDKP